MISLTLILDLCSLSLLTTLHHAIEVFYIKMYGQNEKPDFVENKHWKFNSSETFSLVLKCTNISDLANVCSSLHKVCTSILMTSDTNEGERDVNSRTLNNAIPVLFLALFSSVFFQNIQLLTNGFWKKNTF